MGGGGRRTSTPDKKGGGKTHRPINQTAIWKSEYVGQCNWGRDQKEKFLKRIGYPLRSTLKGGLGKKDWHWAGCVEGYNVRHYGAGGQIRGGGCGGKETILMTARVKKVNGEGRLQRQRGEKTTVVAGGKRTLH